MTGRTKRQYRRRAHYPARINFGITNELRAALEALADKADTCVAEVARDCIEAGIGAVRARLRSCYAWFCCSEGDGPVSFKASPAPSPPPLSGWGSGERSGVVSQRLTEKSVPGLPVLRPRSPRFASPVSPFASQSYPVAFASPLSPSDTLAFATSQPAQSGPRRRRCPGRQSAYPMLPR